MGMCMCTMLRSQERDWTAMPLDILEQISDRLPLVDYVRFRGVCKHWRSSPSARAELINSSKDRPWAIFYELQRDETCTPTCYVYSESHPRWCAIKLHGLEGATVVESKHGWLLAHRGQLFFLYNPLTFSRIDLPKLNLSKEYACTFTYLPTCRSNIVVVHRDKKGSDLQLSMCRVGDKEWSTEPIPDTSGDFIDTIAKVITCNLIHDEDDQCDSAVKNTVCIYEFNNVLTYDHVTKEKTLLFDYLNERYKRKNGEKVISVSHRGKISENDYGTTLHVYTPRFLHEKTKYDTVKVSFFEPRFRLDLVESLKREEERTRDQCNNQLVEWTSLLAFIFGWRDGKRG